MSDYDLYLNYLKLKYIPLLVHPTHNYPYFDSERNAVFFPKSKMSFFTQDYLYFTASTLIYYHFYRRLGYKAKIMQINKSKFVIPKRKKEKKTS